MRGSRVQTIVNELHGEKIDIIKWTEDLPTLISESLSPAEIQKVLIDQDNKRIDTELENYHRNNLEGKENITLDDLKDRQGQKRRCPGYDIDMESPYTDFEKYPVLGNVLGRAFDKNNPGREWKKIILTPRGKPLTQKTVREIG